VVRRVPQVVGPVVGALAEGIDEVVEAARLEAPVPVPVPDNGMPG
jgi:hypothetical protein